MLFKTNFIMWMYIGKKKSCAIIVLPQSRHPILTVTVNAS